MTGARESVGRGELAVVPGTEEKQVEDRVGQNHHLRRSAGWRRLRRPPTALAWSGVAAGSPWASRAPWPRDSWRTCPSRMAAPSGLQPGLPDLSVLGRELHSPRTRSPPCCLLSHMTPGGAERSPPLGNRAGRQSVTWLSPWPWGASSLRPRSQTAFHDIGADAVDQGLVALLEGIFHGMANRHDGCCQRGDGPRPP